MSTKSFGFEQNIQWSIAAQYEHVDNVFLSETQKDYLASSILAPRIAYKIEDEYWQGDINATDHLRRTSDPTFNSDDTSAEIKLLRKNTYGFVSTEFSRQDSTVREVDIAERGRVNNDPVIADSSSATWQYQFSPVDQLSVKTDYLRRDYNSKTYTDYNDKKIAALWLRRLTENLAVQTQLYGEEYNSQRADVVNTLEPPLVIKARGNSQTVGAQFGFSGQLTSSIYYNLLAGGARVDLTQDKVLYLNDDEHTPFNRDLITHIKNTNLMSFSSGYKGEKSQFDLSVSKQLNASGSGFQYDSQQINLSGERRLSQFVSVNSSLTYGKQNVVEIGQLTNKRFDRNFSQTQIGLNWQMAQYWFVSCWVQYNTQKYRLNPDTAESLTGSLQLRYAPETIAW